MGWVGGGRDRAICSACRLSCFSVYTLKEKEKKVTVGNKNKSSQTHANLYSPMGEMLGDVS